MLFVVVSCSFDDRVVRYYSFTNEEWAREECCEFEVDIPNEGNYNLGLALRHNLEFPYREIWCAVAMRSDSADWFVDTLQMQLADTLGYWLGSGSSIKTIVAPLSSESLFFHSGTVRVRIEHLGEGTISGVRAVGVEFRVRSDQLGVNERSEF